MADPPGDAVPTSRPESRRHVELRAVETRDAETRDVGAPGSFDEFYRREYPAIVAFAYVLCGRGGLAEDVAQEAFLVTHRSWNRVGTYDRPDAFVRRVVANMAVSQRRRRAAEGRAVARLALRIGPSVDEIVAPDDEFWRAVRSLPHRQAQSLALYYLEDRSAEEIATILGCAPATVRVHLHRGRQALEALLDGRMPS